MRLTAAVTTPCKELRHEGLHAGCHWESPDIRVSNLRSQEQGGLLGVLGGVSLCKTVSQSTGLAMGSLGSETGKSF